MIRTRQRERTRQALVDGAMVLHQQGVSDPTMEELAEAAGVSRATAYRYFDRPSDALWEALMDRRKADAGDQIEEAGCSVADRVLAAEEQANGALFADLDGTRNVERTTLDRVLAGRAIPGERPARRLEYIDKVLEPLVGRISEDDLDLVRHGLALTMGTHVVGALIDTCGLDVDRARAACRFAASAITSAAEAMATASGHDDPAGSAESS